MIAELPNEFAHYIDDAVAAGRYASAQDAVLQALELLQARDKKLETLRADLQIGLDELARGEGIEYDEAGLDALCDAIANGYEARIASRGKG